MDGDLFGGRTQTKGYDWAGFNWWGLFILIIGVLWLADEMDWFAVEWKLMAPFALVFAGIMAFVPRRR
jgi:hypothetical protein